MALLRLSAAAGALFAVGCTTMPLPPLAADHPANAQASEAPFRPCRSRLEADAETLRTRAQISEHPAEESAPMEGHANP